MKLNILKIILLGIVVVHLVACDDENNDEITNSANKKVIQTERIYNGNDATRLTNSITYTNSGALNSYQVSTATAILNVNLTYNQSNQVTSQLINGLGYTYTYNNQGKLERISSNNNKTITNFIYDTRGNIKEAIAKNFDDSGNEISNRTNTFTYENNLLKSISYETSYGQFKFSFLYGNNDNLISVIFEGSNSTNTDTYTINYDNKINPTHKILENINVYNTVGWSFYNFTDGNGLFEEAFTQGLGNGHYLSFYGKNNVITSEIITNIQSRQYQYDNLNFPTQLIKTGTIPNTNPLESYTIEYNYIYE